MGRWAGEGNGGSENKQLANNRCPASLLMIEEDIYIGKEVIMST